MTTSNGIYDDNEFSDDSGWVEELLECPQSASKTLQVYIELFEGETERTPKATRNGCYAETVPSLLSSKPKSASPPGTLKDLVKTSGDMVDNLVDWVRTSYIKDLHRKVVPYGSGRTSLRDERKIRLSELEETDDDDDNRSIWCDPRVELSTLPSPGSSVASDIDSEAETVSTDMLLQSFYKMGRNKLKKAQAIGNYPSWVEDLATQNNYPSWVDDIDKTQLTQHNGSFNVSLQTKTYFANEDTLHQASPTKSHFSRSLSPSFFRHHSNSDKSPPFVLPSSPLKHHRHYKSFKKHPMTDKQSWELESTDTEVLISQPIYGRHPVNMGGGLHSSMYRDKKIQQLHEESLRKTVKRNHRTPTVTNDKSTVKSHPYREEVSPAAKSRSEANSATSMLRPKMISSLPRSHKVQHPITKAGAVQSPETHKKPFKAIKNLKRFEERKKSVDSNDTDRLMRQSPTGIRMVKDVENKKEPSPRTKVVKYRNETPNDRTAFPRRNASHELTKLLESAEKKSVVAKDIVGKSQSVPQTTGGRSFPRTNDPRKFESSVHYTRRSAPRLRTTSVPERLKQSSLADRRVEHGISEPHRNGFIKTNPRYSSRNRLDSEGRSYEGTDSTNTEALAIQPPMPIFDASPSLTTETASTVDSNETATGLLEQEALKTSFLAEKSDLYMELDRSPDERRTPVRGEPRLDWEGNYAFEKEAHSFTKPGIITSFLEDCMRSSQESHLDEDVAQGSCREESASDASERPVETLKNMLFTVQSLAKQTEDEERSDDRIIRENCETGSETLTDEMFSDAMSNEAANADNSLSRAYYHLARLKKLVAVSERVAGLK